MGTTRLDPRRTRSRLAAGPVLGECLQHQRAKRPKATRRVDCDSDDESLTEAGNRRKLSPA